MRPDAEIERLLTLLEQGSEDYEKLAVTAGEAEARYRVAHAKALLASEGTSDAKRAADAAVATERLLLDRKVAEALAGACRERQSSIRTSIDALRTLSANERAIT